jgi:hypothetical protein
MKIKKKEKQSFDASAFSVTLELPVFDRPAYADKTKWPADITQLTSQNISELIGKYTGLLAYVEAQMSKYDQEIIKAEAMLESKSTQMFLDNPGIAHLEKWRRDQKIASDDGVIIIKSALTIARVKKTQAAMYVKNYERQINALSRELTRKLASNDGYNHSKYVKE